jgi:hypothetical protein
MSRQQVRAVIDTYHDHLARFRALQQVPGSNWTDATVAEWMKPYLADAQQALYRRGFTSDEVAELLAEPSPEPRPARTMSEYMDRLFRGDRT